jgi:hypothetical protein
MRMYATCHHLRTNLFNMNLDISHRCTLDELGCLLDDTFDKDDTLVLQTASPLDHLFADLLRRDTHEGLDGLGLLTKLDEDHLVTL